MEYGNFIRLYDQVCQNLLDIGVENITDLNNQAQIRRYLRLNRAPDAWMIRCRIMEALAKCEPLRKISERKFLKVLIVGDGPVNILGFLSAMSHFDYTSKMKILVADVSLILRDVVKETSRLLKEGDFGEVSDQFYKVKEIKYLLRTLPKNLPNYDVVIVTKYINSLSLPERFKFMKDLFNGLKPSALILLIAIPFQYDFWGMFECLYVSYEDHQYSFDTNSNGFRHNDYVTPRDNIFILKKKKIDLIDIQKNRVWLPAKGDYPVKPENVEDHKIVLQTNNKTFSVNFC